MGGAMNKKYLSILLVEDDPDHAEMVLRAFKHNDSPDLIHVVPDGERALDYLFKRGIYATLGRASTPDLVILDLRLPKINGLEILDQIKSSPILHKIPVIILSTSVSEWDVTMAASLRTDGYLAKPFDYKEFIELLSELGIEN